MSDSSVDWDRVHRSNFEMAAFWNVNWIGKARSLLQCARLLEPEVVKVWDSYLARSRGEANTLLADHYQGPYFMLLSFAVESLLKATAVAQNSPRYKAEFRETSRFPKELQKHDLVKLAQFVQLTFSAEEEDLLRRLTRSAVWFGRYPAPLEYTQMSGTQTFVDGNDYSVCWFGSKDIERLNTFILSLPGRLGLNERLWESAV